MIYQVIEKAGNMGIWTRDIKTGTNVNQAREINAVAPPLPPPTPSQNQNFNLSMVERGSSLSSKTRRCLHSSREKRAPFYQNPGCWEWARA